MATPAPQVVLATHTGFTGAFTIPFHTHIYDVDGVPTVYNGHGSEVTGSTDVHTWAEQYVYGAGENGARGYAYKQAPVEVGTGIHRISCTFSLSLLPTDPYEDYTDIFAIADSSTNPSDPESWDWIVVLNVDKTGRLAFSNGWSTSTISAGTSYDLEFYLYAVGDEANWYWDVYIDGDLWLHDTVYWSYLSDQYIQFMAGFSGLPEASYSTTGPGTRVDATLHVENLVWKMEASSAGRGRWMMMAPDII